MALMSGRAGIVSIDRYEGVDFVPDSIDRGQMVVDHLNGRDFTVINFRDIWSKVEALGDAPTSLSPLREALCLSPKTHQTDGFFICILERSVEK